MVIVNNRPVRTFGTVGKDKEDEGDEGDKKDDKSKNDENQGLLDAKEICVLKATYVKMEVPARTYGSLNDDVSQVLSSDHSGIWVEFRLK